ncbi:AraC family transcriptional regulator [Bradyrhizobium sp. dw_78]|uniref:AraC family transcriptional regulator n=1 Tax=Bradyrhizobium sp. dw_78 TaxID=2719793 RepID=UPI001BD54D4E|nr:AraC family transcriptional regulator [Bradyrhizobium sp. dw_78]
MTLPEADDEWPGRAWRGRLDIDQSLLTQSIAHSDLNVIRHARRSGGGGWSNPSSVADGFVVTPCLLPTRLAEVQFDGRTVASSVLVPRGGLLVYSMKSSYQVHIPDPFDAVSFRLDQALLDRAAQRLGLPSAPELSEPFLSTSDEVLVNLSRALLPALRRPAEVTRLFAGHVVDAVVFHLVGKSARVRTEKETVTRQPAEKVQAALEYMLDCPSDDVDAAKLADLCGLSIDQFNRAFKIATGIPPHQWLVGERVRRARELLAETTIPISDIALCCGFADQSHLTRVFKGHVGASPGAWRREARK